jgi:hypothetical protein
VRPVGVDLQCGVKAIGKTPEQLEAVPAQVKGNIRQRPFLSLADALVVVRVGHHPVRRTLEDHQLSDLGRDARADLMAGGAGADHRDAYSAPVEMAVPLRGVKRGPGEGGQSGDIGQFRPVQHADRGHQHARDKFLSRAIGALRRDAPARACLVITGIDNFCGKTDLLAQIVFVRDFFKIIPEFVALGEEMRPVVIGFECVGVKVVGGVDAAARICVFIPGAADGRVLLEDDKGNAGLLQLNSCVKPRHAGPDDDHFCALQHLRAGRPAPFQAARCQGIVGQILAHHRDIVVRHHFAGGDRHHLAQQRIVGLPGPRFSAARDLRQHIGEPVADLCPKRLGHEFLIAHGAADERLCGFQPVPLAGELHQRKQQRGRVGRLQCAPQLGVFAWRLRPGIEHLSRRPAVFSRTLP